MQNVVLDACCLLNLFAAMEVLPRNVKSAVKMHVPAAVRAEALFLKSRISDGETIKIAVDLSTLRSGLISLCEPMPGEEIATYVELAQLLDDGEAMALAIASVRNFWIATDDRKAKRFAIERKITVITTPYLLKSLVEANDILPDQLGKCLHTVENHACYTPPTDDLLFGWWNKWRVGAV